MYSSHNEYSREKKQKKRSVFWNSNEFLGRTNIFIDNYSDINIYDRTHAHTTRSVVSNPDTLGQHTESVIHLRIKSIQLNWQQRRHHLIPSPIFFLLSFWLNLLSIFEFLMSSSVPRHFRHLGWALAAASMGIVGVVVLLTQDFIFCATM